MSVLAASFSARRPGRLLMGPHRPPLLAVQVQGSTPGRWWQQGDGVVKVIAVPLFSIILALQCSARPGQWRLVCARTKSRALKRHCKHVARQHTHEKRLPSLQCTQAGLASKCPVNLILHRDQRHAPRSSQGVFTEHACTHYSQLQRFIVPSRQTWTQLQETSVTLDPTDVSSKAARGAPEYLPAASAAHNPDPRENVQEHQPNLIALERRARAAACKYNAAVHGSSKRLSCTLLRQNRVPLCKHAMHGACHAHSAQRT